MKKLMIAVAAVACAAVANAANFNWSLGDATAMYPEGNAPGAGLYGGSISIYSAADFLNFDGSVASLAALTALQGPITPVAQYGEEAVAYTDVFIERTGFSEGADTLDSLNVVFVGLNASGDQYMTYETSLIGSTPNGEQKYNDITMAAFTAGGFSSFTSPEPPPDDPTGTPEPTSGLLMLVGLAGLALKRRRA